MFTWLYVKNDGMYSVWRSDKSMIEVLNESEFDQMCRLTELLCDTVRPATLGELVVLYLLA